MLPSTPPTLIGPRLAIRPFGQGDAAMVATVADDPLIPLITSVPASGEPDDVRAYIARQNARTADGLGYSFAIVDRMTDDAVGQIGLWTSAVVETGRASIGYWLAPPARRQGYASEALRILVGWAIGLPEIKRLELYVEPWNEASWRAAEACGFVREGLMRSWQRVGDERRDMYMYSLVP